MKLEGASARAKRIRRSPDEWQALINQFDRSRLSRKAFCQQQSLAISTFDLWRRRLKIIDADMPEPTEALFVELPARDESGSNAHTDRALPNTASWDIELQIGDGVVLRLRQAC
jgi:hypothetical protein